jgi:hypothetical protein
MPRLSAMPLASSRSTSARESIEPSRNSHLLPTNAPMRLTPWFWAAFTAVCHKVHHVLANDTSVSHPCLPETHLLHESSDSRLPMLYTTITADAFSYCATQPAQQKV